MAAIFKRYVSSIAIILNWSSDRMEIPLQTSLLVDLGKLANIFSKVFGRKNLYKWPFCEVRGNQLNFFQCFQVGKNIANDPFVSSDQVIRWKYLCRRVFWWVLGNWWNFFQGFWLETSLQTTLWWVWAKSGEVFSKVFALPNRYPRGHFNSLLMNHPLTNPPVKKSLLEIRHWGWSRPGLHPHWFFHVSFDTLLAKDFLLITFILDACSLLETLFSVYQTHS